MTDNTIYIAMTLLALTGWALVFASACTRFRGLWIAGTVVPLLLCGVYGLLLMGVLPFEQGGFKSIDGVSAMFAKTNVALMGWVHYLAFDLFIGAWQVRQAEREELPLAVTIPSLLLTLVFGPLGLLCFFTLRYLVGRSNVKEERSSASA